jgi:hypothetical protein
LTGLSCRYNPMTSLLLPTSTSLTIVNCSNCLLTTLDISRAPNLRAVLLDGNSFTDLNIASNTILSTIFAQNNNIDQAAATSIATSLLTSGLTNGCLYIGMQSNGPLNLTGAPWTTLTARGWTVG